MSTFTKFDKNVKPFIDKRQIEKKAVNFDYFKKKKDCSSEQKNVNSTTIGLV